MALRKKLGSLATPTPVTVRLKNFAQIVFLSFSNVVCSCFDVWFLVMGKHLTAQEADVVDTLSRKKTTSTKILTKLNKARERKGVPVLGIDAVLRLLRGETHHRSRVEKRGRPKKLTRGLVTKLNKKRRQLLKKANSEKPVTYDDVIKKAKMKGKVSKKTVSRGFKRLNINFRPARKKPHRTKEEIARRHMAACAWSKKPKEFWTKEVHGYLDNKKFVVPINRSLFSMFW